MEAVVARSAAWRAVVADLFEMTKPKVQSLLLFTTVTTMYVAGDPSLGLVALTCLGGALSAGGAGAINHVLDRDIDRKMSRTANRPVASGRISPAAGLAFGIALGVAAFVLLALDREPAGGGAVALRPARLRVRLHALAEAHDPAEHRDRRGRRRGAAARGLGRRDRRADRHAALPVRDRLLLDAAALLGAVAADEGRVRARGRADAPRGARRARDAPPDPALHDPAVRGHPAPVLRGRVRDDVPGGLGAARRGLHLRRGEAARARRSGATRCGCTCSRWPTWPRCSRRWWPTSGSRWRARDRGASSPCSTCMDARIEPLACSASSAATRT